MKNLLISPLFGGFLLCILFAGCFLFVHILLLIKIGWNYQTGKREKEKPQEPLEKPQDAPAPKTPQPVYYIVEKKKKKPKNYYTEPKEFRFK